MTHMFDMRCRESNIEHRLTKVKHPWTNGQIERTNRTIKEATVKRYHYDSHQQHETHLHDFMAAYNFGRRLKTLKGLTPYEFICKRWTAEPDRSTVDPLHEMLGLNIFAIDRLTAATVDALAAPHLFRHLGHRARERILQDYDFRTRILTQLEALLVG